MAFHCEILTLFPGMIEGYASQSILGKARDRGHVTLVTTDIRRFAIDKHNTTDDSPYGGGAGMVMKVEPLVAAIEAAKQRRPGAKVVLMSPRGQPFVQTTAHRYAQADGLILVCGRYEGVDERVLASVDEQLSVGDFVLTGGELAALCVYDAVSRLFPGVLGNAESSATESFEQGTLEFPQYTRPAEFRGVSVPAVLQNGDHARIARWRRWHALRLTQQQRPDLFAKLVLGDDGSSLSPPREAKL